jgi:acyl-CoA oxidase
VLHSPTLTATKWWPGGMGKTCTHAVVMARLILDGRDHGPHAFITQLRDLEDHRPMPGGRAGALVRLGNGGIAGIAHGRVAPVPAPDPPPFQLPPSSHPKRTPAPPK